MNECMNISHHDIDIYNVCIMYAQYSPSRPGDLIEELRDQALRLGLGLKGTWRKCEVRFIKELSQSPESLKVKLMSPEP